MTDVRDGDYPHNTHFAAMSAAMEGRRVRAMEAAETTRATAHVPMWRDPDIGGMMQHFALTPLYTMVRFQMWEQVLAEPAPPDVVERGRHVDRSRKAGALAGSHYVAGRRWQAGW